jgi:transcription initiation factor TFIIIB Brf1 subunit/transcription initiation factor TFIIB
MKTCSNCKEDKPPKDFYGKRTVCRKCDLICQKEGRERRMEVGDGFNKTSGEWLRKKLVAV